MLWWVSVAPLGRPVVPDVYWMLQHRRSRGWPRARAVARRNGVSHLQQLIPAQHAVRHSNRLWFGRRWRVCPDEDQALQLRQPGGTQLSELCVFALWTDLADHLHVVRIAKSLDQHQRLALRLVQSIFQLDGAVCGIDVDQNGPDFGGRKLCHHPLGAVGRPDTDAVASPDSQRQQTASGTLHFAYAIPRSCSACADAAPPAHRGLDASRQCRQALRRCICPAAGPSRPRTRNLACERYCLPFS